MTETTLSVPEVHCDHCVNSIEGAVNALEGVQTAKVDLDKKDVSVTYDGSKLGAAEIIAAVQAQGYDVAAKA